MKNGTTPTIAIFTNAVDAKLTKFQKGLVDKYCTLEFYTRSRRIKQFFSGFRVGRKARDHVIVASYLLISPTANIQETREVITLAGQELVMLLAMPPRLLSKI